MAEGKKYNAIQLETGGGQNVNPASDDTLQNFLNTFSARIPKPISINDNGQVEVLATVNIDAVQIKDSSGTVINPATEDTLSNINTNIDTKLSTRASEDTLSAMNGKMDVNLSEAGKEYLYNSSDSKSIYDRLVEILNQLDVALSTRASEDTLSSIDSKVIKADTDNVGIAEDKVGLAKENTLESINNNIDTQLSTRASESTQSSILSQIQTLNNKIDELENKLDDLDPLQSDYIELKFSGSYDSGTYTADYTPANGEIDYIDLINLNSDDGNGTLTIDYNGDVKGRVSVDYFYNVMNAEQHIKIKVVGDGTKKITLTLNTGSNGHYFAKAIIWKVKR